MTGTSAAVSVALIGALDALTPGRMTPGTDRTGQFGQHVPGAASDIEKPRAGARIQCLDIGATQAEAQRRSTAEMRGAGKLQGRGIAGIAMIVGPVAKGVVCVGDHRHVVLVGRG